MTLRAARRIPREELPATLGTLADPPATGSEGMASILPRTGRIARQVELDAAERARALIANAEAEAAAHIARAEAEASGARQRAEEAGRAEGAARTAALAVRLAAEESIQEERLLERAITMAQLLAERLLGEALALDRTRVVALARTALKETGGARQVILHAHPEDAQTLEAERGQLGLPAEAVRILADPARTRGSLRVDTELGVLDADLAPQLERLTALLRESLRS
ncbi:MAG: hypothetical protein KIT72_06175 [Polyangiaceae bacterium]|nr:hypothetical protein [Polyangiaceae bacterium]MCW5789987.1 hypothetical protein [Polyangiaceae bacterium]